MKKPLNIKFDPKSVQRLQKLALKELEIATEHLVLFGQYCRELRQLWHSSVPDSLIDPLEDKGFLTKKDIARLENTACIFNALPNVSDVRSYLFGTSVIKSNLVRRYKRVMADVRTAINKK